MPWKTAASSSSAATRKSSSPSAGSSQQRNIDFQSVRPAEILSAATKILFSGVKLRWPHRLQVYVPSARRSSSRRSALILPFSHWEKEFPLPEGGGQLC